MALVGHVFLPDSARRVLGLPDNESRLARDSYLLAAMLASRPEPGAVQIILGKTTAQGDALKPSRLLFRCADDQALAARAVRLFARPASAPAVLSPLPPEWRLRVGWQEPPAASP
jgi:ATP-dependent helicase/nuclease subunit B